MSVLVLCQSNRDAEKDKAASLRHLRESDAIGQTRTSSWFWSADLWVAIQDAYGLLTLIKNRFGPKGKLRLNWEPEYTRFFTSYVPPIKDNPNYGPAFADFQ